jgi:hypothetical protein
LAAKAELLQASAQDEFAKWAKLRRIVDKKLAELEKLSEYGPSLFYGSGMRVLCAYIRLC